MRSTLMRSARRRMRQTLQRRTLRCMKGSLNLIRLKSQSLLRAIDLDGIANALVRSRVAVIRSLVSQDIHVCCVIGAWLVDAKA